MSAVPEDVSVSSDFPVVGKTYYISGVGLATHQKTFEPLSAGEDRETLPKGLKRYAGLIHRLRYDPVYGGEEGVVHIQGHEVLKHQHIHELPSREDVARIFKTLADEPKIPFLSGDREKNALREHLSDRIKTEDALSLAEIIRDSKTMFKGGLNDAAHVPLANVVAHSYEVLPGEALVYLRKVSGTSRWPQWLPVVPESRATLQAIVKRLAAQGSFTPEWYKSIGGTPIGGLLAPVASAPSAPRAVTIGIVDERKAPVKSAAKASALKAAPVRKAAAPERPEDYKVKFIRADGINAAAPFTRETRIYKQLMASVTLPIEKKLVEAAVFRATQGDMLEMSRLFLSPELSVYNLARDYHAQPGTADWGPDDIRSHFAQKLNYWLHQVQVDGKLMAEDKPDALALYLRISKTRKVPSNLVFSEAVANPPAVEQDNTAPAATVAATVVEEEPIKVTAGALEVARTLAAEPPALKTHFSDTVTATIVFKLRGNAHDEMGSATREEIDYLRGEGGADIETINLAQKAASVLSPLAFKVFSSAGLRTGEARLSLDTVAKTLGVDRGAASAIFNGSTQIVRESAPEYARHDALAPR